MAPAILVLWIYIVLLVAGGLVGFFKVGSKVSLISAIGFAIPLIACALGYLPAWLADVLIFILLVTFLIRFAKGRKFMPAGLMVVLSLLALALRQFI